MCNGLAVLVDENILRYLMVFNLMLRYDCYGGFACFYTVHCETTDYLNDRFMQV